MLSFQVPLDGRNAGKQLETARAGVLNLQVHHFDMFTQMGTAFEGMGMGAWGEVAVEQGNRNRVLILIVAALLILLVAGVAALLVLLILVKVFKFFRFISCYRTV